MDAVRLEAALETLRPALTADGFHLRLGAVDPDGPVEVVVEAMPDACLDCLVPDETLVEILESSLQEENPAAGPVVLTKIGFDAITEP